MENKTLEEIRIGDSASMARTLTQHDIELFAAVSGDSNPAERDGSFQADGQLHRVVGHSMWGGALISSVLGTQLPGPGTVYVGQDMRFVRQVRIGDTVTTTVTVREKRPIKGTVLFDCVLRNQHGDTVMTGIAEVLAPVKKVSGPDVELPEVMLNKHSGYHRLLDMCDGIAPAKVAVAHPCDRDSLLGPLEAAKLGLIEPILIGPADKIRAAAEAEGADISAFRIVNTEHSHQSAEVAVAMVRSGEAEVLMKGSLHTDELMGEVVKRDTGLRTSRRLSHVFVMDVPTYPRFLFITDAAISIAPTLEEKVDICQNAIDLAHAMGVPLPRVAVLAAVETINYKMPSTLDAAALCKMADRGQITGALLDGPLAFDNAVSMEAAKTKKIESEVAGRADILLVPDIEAGNMLAKQLSLLAGADSAGIVLGARAPIVLTSRSDNVRTRVASCAVGSLLAQAKRVARAAGGK